MATRAIDDLTVESLIATGPAIDPLGELDVAVRATGVTRRFGDREVLQGVDLTLHRNEFVALLGRSGSGKSTLLRAFAALDDGVEGSIAVPERRSVVFQDARLLPWASVLDNVTLGLRDRRAAARGLATLAEVGLGGHEGDWPKTLSGGEAQRAALARALVREPDLLLLDEPFGALDALTRIRMHGLLQELCARHRPAVLLVTHDVDEAILLADRVLVLTDGVISLDAPVDVPSPRLRGDRRFRDLRSRLLVELGVDEAVEGHFDRDVPASNVPTALTPTIQSTEPDDLVHTGEKETNP
jgi:sulfonate transport system ATP-binding protein